MAEETEPGGEPVQCSACSGSGSVISGLGGEPQSVSCPWCDGTGSVIAGHDAQARWAAEAPAES